MSLTKGDNPDPVLRDDTITYTLKVSNTDKKKAKKVMVEDLLPEGVTFQSVSTSKGKCETRTRNGRTLVTCDVGDLEEDKKDKKDKKASSATITIRVAADRAGTITNTARATPDKGQSAQASEQTTVIIPNRPPSAVNDTVVTDEDTAATFNVLDNDTDPDGDPLTAELVTGPQNGTVNCGPGGSCTYEPNQNFNGPDSFTYQASDGNGGTDTATVTINVAAENDAPSANGDTAQTDEDMPVNIDVVANDTDPEGDPLTLTSVTEPGNGTATINTNNTVTYTPNENFSGTDTFEYRINDGNGGTDTATVTVNVDAVNDAPAAGNDDYQTGEESDPHGGCAGRPRK